MKNVKKTHLNIQLGRWNFDFLGSSFAAVTLLPANFCRLKIGEEQFKSIGSGLCKSQICSIYLYKSNDYQEQKHKIKCRRKRNKASKLLLKRYIFSHCFYIFKRHVFPHCFRIFNSNYYNLSVAQLALINLMQTV